MTTIALLPRDGIFCKDGRDWHTSASGRGHGLDWPWPSTVLGALRTAWGRRQEAKRGTTFGPEEWRTQTAAIQLGKTLVLRRPYGAAWAADHRVWPVPNDALWHEDVAEVHRIEPIEPTLPTLGRDDDEIRERLMRPMLDDRRKPLHPPRWWSNDDFTAWLAGRSVPARAREQTLVTTRRRQAHVGIRPEELTADEGILFSHDVVETLEPSAEWAIGVEVVLPDDDLPTSATLGSDARLVRVEPLPNMLFEPPTPVLEAFKTASRGLRIVAVTPMGFERGWLPDGLNPRDGTYQGTLPGFNREVILRAAFVSRPLHVSGWDMAAGAPKPTLRMVPPGTVYFFEATDSKPFSSAEVRSLWLAAIGSRIDAGFGRIVPGVWSPTRSHR